MKRVIVTALIMLITTGCTFKYVPPEKRTEETTTVTQTETTVTTVVTKATTVATSVMTTAETQPEIPLSEADKKSGYVFVDDGSPLNMRSKPDTESEIVTTIPKNMKVEILGATNGWYKVKYKDYTGFVYSSYIASAPDYHQDETLTEYYNVKFGYSVKYPSNFNTVSETAEGKTVSDGEIQITFSSQFNNDGYTLDKKFIRASESTGKKVIAKSKESDYYILEWEDEDKKIVYYRKEYVGDKVTKIEVEYPDGKDCEGLINQLLRDFSLD